MSEEQPFDTSMVAQHPYLGDLSDVPRTHEWAPLFQPGLAYDLPLLPLENVVMLPGAIVPLHMNLHADELRLALAAPAPMKNLLAVVCALPTRFAGVHLCQRVGCIVELQKQSEAQPPAHLLHMNEEGDDDMDEEGDGDDGDDDGEEEEDGDGVDNGNNDNNRGGDDNNNEGVHRVDEEEEEDGHACYLAKGLCRFSLSGTEVGPHRLARCIILSQETLPMMPREAADGRAYVPPWVCRLYDCNSLAQVARDRLQQVAPKVQPPVGDACQLSYWLVRNMPLECAVRQKLLEINNIAHRLKEEIMLLERMARVCCCQCGVVIGQMQDALSMTDTGAAGIFVNPHGYVHDMLALQHARHVQLDGQPETRDCWFPGYAWTIANCNACGGHLGWRFTAVEPQLVPREFFGIRRDRIAPTEM